MYYVIACPSPADGYNVKMAYKRDSPLRSWTGGRRFSKEPPSPIRVDIEMQKDTVIPEFSSWPIPLISERLHKAFLDAGIANIDTYSADLVDVKTDTHYSGYVAFNLIGTIAAADLGKSRHQSHDGPLISVDFDSLSIDEAKTRGALMFRLAESTNAILVHESVAAFLKDQGFTSLEFLAPEEWAG